MKVKVYGYRNCSTCRKAYSFLDQSKIPFDEIDITQQAPAEAELEGMLDAVGGQLKKLFNTSGQVYREEKISGKLPQLSTKEALALLASNGRLVKRPFLLVDGKPMIVGFDEAKWAKILNSLHA